MSQLASRMEAKDRPCARQKAKGSTETIIVFTAEADTWTKTNIDTHISRVNNSGRRNEIIALKSLA